jgi:hypothetical protein
MHIIFDVCGIESVIVASHVSKSWERVYNSYVQGFMGLCGTIYCSEGEEGSEPALAQPSPHYTTYKLKSHRHLSPLQKKARHTKRKKTADYCVAFLNEITNAVDDFVNRAENDPVLKCADWGRSGLKGKRFREMISDEDYRYNHRWDGAMGPLRTKCENLRIQLHDLDSYFNFN